MSADDLDRFDEFEGLDAPRPLPDDLRTALLGARSDLDAAAALEACASAQPLPGDLHDRLVAVAAQGMPRSLRRRLLRRAGVVPIVHGPAWMQAAAVFVVVLLVAGGVALANEGRHPAKAPDVAAPPTSTTMPPTTTTPLLVDVPTTSTPPTTAKPRPAKPRPKPPEALLAVATCDELLNTIKAAALERVSAFGIGGGGGAAGRAGVGSTPAPATSPTTAAPAPPPSGSDAPPAASEEPAADAAFTPASPTEEFSETNVQEAGVDEPDIVKTDGKRVFALVADPKGPSRTLRTLRVDADGPKPVGSTAIPAGDFSMLLAGNRLVLVGRDYGGPTSLGASRAGSYWTSVLTYDVTDLAKPALLHARFLEGHYVAARYASGVVRLVVHSFQVAPSFVRPADSTPEAAQRALEANREIVRTSKIDDWVPRMVSEHRGGSSKPAATTRLCECDDTLRPPAFGEFSSLSVVTVDPMDVDTASVAAVQGGGSTVYASPSGLYVFTASMQSARNAIQSGQPAAPASAIHRFDITGRAPAVYEASGPVRGHVLNPFSMSEHDGHLRIATTGASDEGMSESFVSVLKRDGPAMVTVGQVGGLGRGEQIHGVRFIGTRGYVVTFRQTDPLYVVDLSVPAQPKVLGELKITGYSAYLHPIDEGHLIGVGQEATQFGSRQGTQVSVFDVTDPANPRRTHQELLGQGSQSTAEFDHHAFLYWARTGATVIPVADQRADRADVGYGPTYRVAVFDAGPDRLSVKGTLTHDDNVDSDYSVQILRSWVIGGSLYTLSAHGVMANDLGSLDQKAWVQF
ncbi:MAG TPA: beta-propeller domain-containing protein [Acidimicrobiales bacterium]